MDKTFELSIEKYERILNMMQHVHSHNQHTVTQYKVFPFAPLPFSCAYISIKKFIFSVFFK